MTNTTPPRKCTKSFGGGGVSSPWLVCLVFSMVCMGCAPPVEEPVLDLAGAEANIRKHDTGGEQYNDMVRVLNLDTTTMNGLQRAFAERDDAVEQWLSGEKGQRLIEIEARMVAAVEARNLEAVKSCTAEGKPLRDELRQLIADHEAAILNTLTPEQQIHWQGFEVSNKMLTLMKPLDLAFEQAQAIEQAGASAVAQAMRRGESTPKAAAYLDLEQWAEESVLSPEQREAYQDIKGKNKLRSLGV